MQLARAQLLGCFDGRLGFCSRLFSFCLGRVGSLVGFFLHGVHSAFDFGLGIVSRLLDIFGRWCLRSRCLDSRCWSHRHLRRWRRGFYCRSSRHNHSFFLLATGNQSSRSDHSSQDESIFHINTPKKVEKGGAAPRCCVVGCRPARHLVGTQRRWLPSLNAALLELVYKHRQRICNSRC